MRSMFKLQATRPMWADIVAILLPSIDAGACIPERGTQCRGCEIINSGGVYYLRRLLWDCNGRCNVPASCS